MAGNPTLDQDLIDRPNENAPKGADDGAAPSSAPLPPPPTGKPTRCGISYGGQFFALSSADSVLWELRPGVQPWVGEFTRERTISEAFLNNAKADFCSLDFAGRIFKKLRIIRAVQTDPWHVMIRVADRRHRWRYVRVFGRFNLRRRINDSLRTVDLLQGVAEVQVSKDAQRDDLSTIQLQRYRRWSVKQDGSPYTAKELAILVMKAILAELGEEGFDEEGAEALPDNGEVPDMQEYLGATTDEALGSLLRRAELNVTVDQDGTIRFFDPFAKADLEAIFIKGGAYRRPDLARVRPDHYEVYCLVEKDIRLKYQRVSSQDTVTPVKNLANSKPSDHYFIRNVVQLPLKESIGGKERQPGTWIPIEELIGDGGAWGISEADVRSLWFFGGEGLKLRYARKISSLGVPYFEPTLLQRVNAILRHYRQSFMIDPRLRDMLRSWTAETSAVIDPITHTRQPSPVYGEWYNLYPSLPIMMLSNPNQPRPSMGQNMSSFGSFVPGTNDFKIRIKANYQVAPAELRVIDQDLGVFRVEYHQAIDGSVAERIPSMVESEMQVFDPGARQQLQFLTRNMKLAPSFQLETVISVIEGSPNASTEDPLAAKSLFYGKSFTFDDERGLVPKLQLFCRAETARFDENGKLVNGDQIDRILEAEARAAARSFDDRPVGVFTCAHLPGAEWRVTGHVRGIRFVVETSGATKVIVDASEPAVSDNIMKFLPQNLKNYLQRILPREA